ncbi:hypothetical protein GCM10012275_43480 [Longimycelium tulufanense]|uniref:Uncharacterized protein n=1 Tax=Longimycelium tulufanense TaxID=907463 RepID=A0A8J3FY32_9PSEU|nr:hypothetical protein GCM10012275_43480 [Longimycelium tulufanense]
MVSAGLDEGSAIAVGATTAATVVAASAAPTTGPTGLLTGDLHWFPYALSPGQRDIGMAPLTRRLPQHAQVEAGNGNHKQVTITTSDGRGFASLMGADRRSWGAML